MKTQKISVWLCIFKTKGKKKIQIANHRVLIENRQKTTFSHYIFYTTITLFTDLTKHSLCF